MDYSKILSTWWFGVCYHKEQLDEMLSSTDIKTYAYILHDKDTDTQTKAPKKPHYHFLVQFMRNQRGSYFKRYATDDMGQLFPKPVNCPKGAFDYLIHDTTTAKKDGKYLYDAAERISTIENFEVDEEITGAESLLTDIFALLDGKMTRHEMIKRDAKRVYSIRNIQATVDWLHEERYGDFKEIETTPKKPPQKPQKPKQAEIQLIPVNPDTVPF